MTLPKLPVNSIEDAQYAVDQIAAAFNQLGIHQGNGSPEGVVAAPQGSIYRRYDGGATTSLYVKTSGGSTSTGWTAK